MEHILCPISEYARQTPNATALISDHQSITYAEFNQQVNSAWVFLRESGIQEGQRVAFIAKTHPSTLVLLFALFRIGAVACPLSYRTPQPQILKALESLKTSLFLNPETLLLSPTQKQTDQISLDLPATFLFTSGSSGTPKVASLTFANHYYNAIGVAPALKIAPHSRWLLSLPLFHVSGLSILFRCFTQGATVILSELPIQSAILRFQITHASLVPTQLYRLTEVPSIEKMDSLNCLLLGGAPLSNDLLNQGLNQGLPIVTTYGMTEMSSIITLSNNQQLPHREIKIEKENEIWVRGKTLFQGYWGPEQEEVRKNSEEEWFPTKDLGRFNPDGTLEILGRKDRQFICGGENIQPEEIEKALCAISGIVRASVLPIENKEFGHRPVAFIEGTHLHTLQSIQEVLRQTLPSFKHPIALYPYPKDTGLKPNLVQLKEQLNGFSEYRFQNRS